MTTPSGGDIPVNTFPGIPVNPDGTPNFGGAAQSATGASTGQQSIWNLPKDLPPQLWFDTGHQTAGGDTGNEDRGGLHPGRLGAPDRTPSSYQILRSPQAVMKQFAAMSADPDWRPYLALQQSLGVKLTGKWDASTKNALTGAMQDYVQVSTGAGVGISFKDWLLQGADRAQQLGLANSGAGKAPTPTLMDPAQIRMAAQNAAQQALGQGLSSDQLDKFVQQFQAEQVSNAQTGGGDLYSTSTKLPGEAMAFAQQADPQGFKNNQRQSFVDTLVNMFAPSQSQRPNMTPTPSVNPAAASPAPGGASVRG